MDIPTQFRSKMGVYDKIEMWRFVTKVTIVNEEELLENGISELKSRLGKNLPVVGVDFKRSKCNIGGLLADLLLLYVEGYCLIIQLKQMGTFPDNLGQFLSDKSICFIGFKIDCHFDILKRGYSRCLTGNGAEIRKLAAGVLKKPSLAECGGFALLASEIGTTLLEVPVNQMIKPSDWGALCFSNEEIKYAMINVLRSYCLGNTLLKKP